MDLEAASDSEADWPRDQTDTLAGALRVARADLVAHLGGAWRRFDFDLWPFEGRLPSEVVASTLWFESGEPTQVLLGIVESANFEPDIAVVAFPEFVMIDWRTRYLPSREQARIDISQPGSLVRLQGAVAEVALRRRKSFFWCRTCRTCNPPEDRSEPGICFGCSVQYFGAIP